MFNFVPSLRGLYSYFMADTQSNVVAGLNGLAASIQGAASAGLTRRQRKFQEKQQQKAMDFNAQQAVLARQWQADQWQKQFDITNAYNTPAMQMQRALDAGLNPYAAFSQMGSLQGDSVSTPSSAAAASPGVPDYMSQPNGIQAFQQGFNQFAQNAMSILGLTKDTATFQSDVGQSQQDYISKTLANDLLNGDVSLLPNKLEASRAVYSQQVSDSNYQILKNQYATMNLPEVASNELQQIVNNTALQVASLRAMGLDNQAKELQNEYLPRTLEQTYKNLVKQGLVSDAQIDQLKMLTNTGYAMCAANIENLRHQNANLDSSTASNYASAAESASRTEGNKIDNANSADRRKKGLDSGPRTPQERRTYYRQHGNGAQKTWGSVLDVLDDVTGVLGSALGGAASTIIGKAK